MDTLGWEERPFVALERMASYFARDRQTAQKYGPIVKAVEISNRDYSYRYKKYSSSQAMKPPPSSHIHVYLGFLVVRKLGTPGQYETWMPSDVFDELYAAEVQP
jgi:hypothetical protein